MSPLWMAIEEFAEPLCLRLRVFYRSCNDLFTWRINYNQTQWYMWHHC